MILLTNKEYETYPNQANCGISKKRFERNTLSTKIMVNLQTAVILLVNAEVATHIICDLR